MTAFQTFLVCLTVFTSSVIQASIGIGFAMLASAVLSFLLPPSSSAALIGYAAVVLGVAYSIRMQKHINIRVSMPALLGMMVARILGVITLMHMSADTANTVLGIILLAFTFYFWRFSGKVRIQPNPWKGFVLGLFAGYLGGIYGLTGPFAAVYFYSALTDNREYVACMNFAFLPSGVVDLVMHCYYGNITMENIPIYLMSTAAVLVGVWLGLRFLNKLNREQLARAIYLFMAAMGIIILII